MFKNLTFLKSSQRMESKDLAYDEKYRQMVKSGKIIDQTDSQYVIEGENNLILFTAPDEEIRKNCMYVQSFSYSNYKKNSFTKRANMPSYLLLYTYEGKADLKYGGEEYEMGKGDAFLIDCRKPHEYFPLVDGWIHGDLHFYGGIAGTIVGNLFDQVPPVFHVMNFERFQQQLEKLLRLAEEYAEFRDVQVSIELQKLLLISAKEAGRTSENQPVPEQYKKLRSYIERRFREPVTLEEMAAFTNISKFHLSREFKRYFGASPKDYIMQIRIRQAEMLLESSDLPAYKIGQFVGFQNEANFIKAFKTKTKMTPGEYRGTVRK